MEYKSIAIDGPSGAGKSTLAKQLAEALGFLYVDTGAIYRTVGLHVRRHGAAPEAEDQVVPLLDGVRIEMGYGEDGLQHMYLNGEDVTRAIRENEISHYASAVSALPPVRDFLLEMQRSLARRNNVIMDGRDIGTVVLPDADVKVFLTASPEARASRRWLELKERGSEIDYDTVLAELKQRDYNDMNRDTAPLRQAEDAVLVDTTRLSREESLEALLRVIQERLDG